MSDIKLFEGDLDLGIVDLKLFDSKEKEPLDLLQSVTIILSTRLGEFPFDENLGLVWENLFGKNYNPEYLTTDITNALMEQEPRIQQITSIDFVTEGRKLIIKIAMVGTDGNEMKGEVMIDA